MRGKVDEVNRLTLEAGITPAYAGKSVTGDDYLSIAKDHPRVCGEKAPSPALWALPTGSPPRMRGKGSRCRTLQHRHRITPAYAGKSRPQEAQAASNGDHPRVCGEKWMTSRRATLSTGSPPRMRGKGCAFTGGIGGFGITPAYAGKRRCQGRFRKIYKDHPRVCGEKCVYRAAQHRGLGSPPRMRGKVPVFAGGNLARGITPAYAGKSRKAHFAAADSGDHPRVCGEKRFM